MLAFVRLNDILIRLGIHAAELQKQLVTLPHYIHSHYILYRHTLTKQNQQAFWI